MDAFEHIVSEVLQQQGFWTRTNFRVKLTADDKRTIHRHTSPNWEIDVVAYNPSRCELLVVECKSYFDSSGVRADVFEGLRRKDEKLYKLFCDEVLRGVVFNRLVCQLVEAGLCNVTTPVLCLAAGHIYRNEENRLKDIFTNRGWRLLGPSSLKFELTKFLDIGYENSITAVVAKVLLSKEKNEPPIPDTDRKIEGAKKAGVVWE